MIRSQKRMQSSLSLNEISPHLAAISSTCIALPGHNQEDEVKGACCHSDVVQKALCQFVSVDVCVCKCGVVEVA